jgi:hypothetical protein
MKGNYDIVFCLSGNDIKDSERENEIRLAIAGENYA